MRFWPQSAKTEYIGPSETLGGDSYLAEKRGASFMGPFLCVTELFSGF